MRVDDFDYHLPPDLIAQWPPAARDGGRLMLLDRGTGAVSHHGVRDLPGLLPQRALLVVNDSRVIPARLWARRVSGGRVEVLLVERVERADVDRGTPAAPPRAELVGRGSSARIPERAAPLQYWHCLVRASKALRAGESLALEPRPGAPRPPPSVRVVERREGGRCVLETPPWVELAAYGAMPLPPYIRRADEPADRERYQTVYARDEGSIAAPTAGLHLSAALLHRLDETGVDRAAITLHVGPGTFLPVRSVEVGEHHMEAERYVLPGPTAAAIAGARLAGRCVAAVGTTVVRCLESAEGRAGEGRTTLFVTPGHRFRVVDAMLTNFHLPRSTLLMLVAAFAGREQILAAYRAAVEERYRFYSFGDAMLIV